MGTQIFKLKKQAKDVEMNQAQCLSGYLQTLGFDCEQLEDMLYRVAEIISLKLKDELGEVLARRRADQEFTAAEEINQNSMVDQLIVLRQWYEDENAFFKAISENLNLNFFDVKKAYLLTDFASQA